MAIDEPRAGERPLGVSVKEPDSKKPAESLLSSPDNPLFTKALMMIESLNAHPGGSVLYKQIERVLGDAEQATHARESLFCQIIQNFLSSYINHLEPGSTLHLQAKLIKQQLKPPFTETELKSLQKFLDLYSLHFSRMEFLDESILRNALAPLLEFYTGQSQAMQPDQAQSQVQSQKQSEMDEIIPDMAEKITDSNFTIDSDTSKPNAKQVIEDLIDELLPSAQKNPEQKMQSSYNKYLGQQKVRANKIQYELSQRINETISKHQNFNTMLEIILTGLKEADSIEDIHILRDSLVEDVSGLMDTQKVLVDNLEDAKNYLRMIETDSQQLSNELARVRQLSMTDELTALPNRRAFMARLEDELGRAKRYGFKLSLAMLDLDHFKAINDKYGHPAGDDVLKIYSNQVLDEFRQHDLVCRFGGEEFAVMFPNTSEKGALAALRKVKEKVATLTFKHAGLDIPLPTFSAGLSILCLNDDSGDIIKRADQALYDAKRLGRNRIELANPGQDKTTSSAS